MYLMQRRAIDESADGYEAPQYNISPGDENAYGCYAML